MVSLVQFASRRSHDVRRQAARFAANGWPVARLAVRRGGQCICPLRDCIESHLTLRPPVLVTRVRDAESLWRDYAWGIALVTHHYDVLRLPAAYGAHVHQVLGTACPTAICRATRAWQFFLAPGELQYAEAAAVGGDLVAGPSAWVPAPGTEGEEADAYRWLVPPHLTSWRPCGDTNAIRAVLRTTDWNAADAPSRGLPAILERVLR